MGFVSRVAPFLVAALAVAAAALWGLHLAVDPDPFAGGAAAVVALTLVVLTVVTAGGLLLARSRWARRLLPAVAGAMIALAAPTPMDPMVATALALAAAAAAGAAGPWLGRWARRRPAAGGPSPLGTAALLGSLALPGAVGLIRHGGLSAPDWIVVGGAAAGTWLLSRARPSGLWILRVGLPAAAVAAALVDGVPSGPLLAAAVAIPSALAWKVDLGPDPVLPSERLPIPPELAPLDVLQAAGYDDTGRPQGRRP